MSNPWNDININTYEKHMSLNSVYQLQTMSKIMKEQFYAFPAKSVMILGIAGGNGLEHIDPGKIDTVYGVDINESYLDVCKNRYPQISGVLHTLCVDLTKDISLLPESDFVIANLLIEYVGYDNFAAAVRKTDARYVSCVIQVNEDNSFVSDSPYIHEFDHLDEVLHQTEETDLIKVMSMTGYSKSFRCESELPNGKKLVRIDFTSDCQEK